MNTIEIVKDALKYHLSDWRKILILGVFIIISGLANNLMFYGVKDVYILSILAVIGFIIGFFINGYV